MNYIEIFGYIASILIAISLTMSQLLKLRIINLVGALSFSIYGYVVGAYPVMIVNGFITIIDIYYLIIMYKNRDEFDILGASNKDYLYRFYDHYAYDIKKFFPDFDDNYLKDKKSLFIMRNMRPVNLVVFNEQENGITEILLDYAIPDYRDSLNGKYLLSIFKDCEGETKQLVVKTDSSKHIKYLKKIGFIQNSSGLYVIKI